MTNLTNTAADQIIEREAIRTAKEITASLGDVTVLPEHVNPSDLPGGRWHRFQTEAEVEEWIEANGGEDLAVRDREGWYSIPRPVVGAPVSQGFNGDYYPQGEIAKVSPTGKKITTTTGVVFYRKGQTAAWLAHGTWAMVAGHQSRWNPHF